MKRARERDEADAGDAEYVNGTRVFLPPIVRPLLRDNTTYAASLPLFLLVAHHALHLLTPVHGHRWYIDGHTSDRLFLRLPCDQELVGIPYLEQDFSLQITPTTVQVGVSTYSHATLGLHRQFTLMLDQWLPRSTSQVLPR
ncbi:hypothetical protein HNQ07_004123 [Deinococcus metalli]|uniref:Uncharacterized protein n=1 Tax=Deinococcus metalli TaxID=1141878 RepID=A0A7W8KKF9_9DEIO|nr:hypothetical protein [Deinococcus metalli]MBB5378616.1 hypothetical protein [Deinococcus metalli]GHF61168.1 hypothetical protein GCM10017781_41650 [Deinococcus metalli]